MESNHLLFIKSKKVLDFAFENKRDFRQRQSSCVDFSALYVSDLVITYTVFDGKLILRYALLQSKLAKPFTQVETKPILIFWRHGSKLPLSLAPDRPIYRVMSFLFLSFGMKKETIISLGWDVGGYSGNKNAFALATQVGKNITLEICTGKLSFVKTSGCYEFPKNLFNGSDRSIIAIDAPFGFPNALLAFIRESTNAPGKYHPKDADNDYVFRKTDLDVIKLYKKHPLSPVFSNLGRNTFRAIRQLREWKKTERNNISILPWDNETKGTPTVIEVYPGILTEETGKLCSRFATCYKDVLNEAKASGTSNSHPLFVPFKRIYLDKETKDKVPENDEVDAAICALMGLEFANEMEPNFFGPSPPSMQEGAIYKPAFQNIKN